MAMNLGRGGVQELGTGQSNALLGSQQALRTERVADARATAGMELKRMQEEADAMGISMGRYVERNQERFKGAMTTLYGGGRNARERAETSYGEVLNGPETKEQLERYTESEWWRENGRGVDWAPAMGESGMTPAEGGQTAPEATPTVAPEPTIAYTNDAGAPITEEQYNDQQGTYEAALEAGDATAASMVKPEDREAMLAYLEEESKAGNEWAKSMLEQYNDPANFDPDNPFASAKQNEIMTSIIRDVGKSQNTRSAGAYGPEVLQQPQAYEQFLQVYTNDYTGTDKAEIENNLKLFNEMTPQDQQFTLAYIALRDREGATSGGNNVLNPDVFPQNMDPGFFMQMFDKYEIDLDKLPKPDRGVAPGQPPEMRLRGFNRNEITPEQESAPTPPPETMQRGTYFGDVQKFEEDYQQSTGSELNRTNQQLVAARQNQANVDKTAAETDYLRAREDSEYAGVELAYAEAEAALMADGGDPVAQAAALDAMKGYNELVQTYGAPPRSRTVAGLQNYVDSMNKNDRERYNTVMGGFADQIRNNPTLAQYYEVVPVYSTSGAERRAAEGTPSQNDEDRSRVVDLVLPRQNNYVGTTADELGNRLVSETG